MSRRRTLLVVLAVVVAMAAVMSTIGPAVSPALAAGGCGTYKQTGWNDGFIWYPANNPEDPYYEGVSTYILVQTSTQCSGILDPDYNYVAAWSMIASKPGTNGYAQSGFEKDISPPHNATYWFSQWLGGGLFNSEYSTYAQSSQVGVKHAFRSLYTSNCACVRMYVDSVEYDHTPFSPFAAWTTPFSPQYYGEAGYRESDMPGLSTSRTAFTAMGAQLYSDAVTSIACGLQVDNEKAERWANVPHSCIAFDIYTKDGA